MNINELILDNRNANKGTKRGRKALKKSLEVYGAGRSILIDKDNQVIAGNKTVTLAQEMGLPVRVVETDGNEIIAVKRIDLDLNENKARGLALADNRVGQLDLNFDAEEITNCITEKIIDPIFFNIAEQKYFSKNMIHEETILTRIFELNVECQSEEELRKTYDKLKEQGYKCRLSIF